MESETSETRQIGHDGEAEHLDREMAAGLLDGMGDPVAPVLVGIAAEKCSTYAARDEVVTAAALGVDEVFSGRRQPHGAYPSVYVVVRLQVWPLTIKVSHLCVGCSLGASSVLLALRQAKRGTLAAC